MEKSYNDLWTGGKGLMEKRTGKSRDVIEIDLLEVLIVLLEHWLPLCLVTVVAGISVLFACRFIIVPQYASTSILYVLSRSTSITSLADLQIGSSLTADYVEVVGGRPVLDRVINNLELDLDYAGLAEKISLENPNNTRLLKITVTDADPELAKEITDEVAKVSSNYIAQKMDQDAPTIIQYGYSDEEAVSPHTMRDSAIGAVVGLLISSGIVLLIYFMNDTVKGPEDAERRVGLQVLGTLPFEEGWESEKRHTKSEGKRRLVR